MNTGTRYEDLDSPNGVRPHADVQRLWRKRGWQPPTEYRQDFRQSCRPAIYAGMERLEMVKAR